jgi:hypothetical protein
MTVKPGSGPTSGNPDLTQVRAQTATDVAVAGALGTGGATVADLDPAAAVGARGFVTDATAPTFGATVVGGGAVGVPVYFDGTNWCVG